MAEKVNDKTNAEKKKRRERLCGFWKTSHIILMPFIFNKMLLIFIFDSIFGGKT